MKILIFIILFILILLCVKIKVGIQIYDGDINLLLWKFKIPLNKKIKEQEGEITEDKKGKKPKKTKKTLKKEKSNKKPRKKNYFNNINDFKELIIGFKNTISISDLSIDLLIAGDDAAMTAKLYGSICGFIGAILPTLESNFKICKKRIYINIDFEKTQIEYKVYLLIETRIIKSLFMLIKKYKNIKNIIMED